MTSLYVDGDIFASDGGTLVRFIAGKNDGWDATPPQDTLLRPAPTYSLVTGGGERRKGGEPGPGPEIDMRSGAPGRTVTVRTRGVPAAISTVRAGIPFDTASSRRYVPGRRGHTV